MKNSLYFLLLVITLSCSKQSKELTKITPPIADFTYKSAGIINTAVTFDNKSVNAKIYNWDFGDSTTSQEENPVHVYKREGHYSVILVTYGEPGNNVSNDVKVESLWINDPSK